MRNLHLNFLAFLFVVLPWNSLSADIMIVLDFNESSQANTSDIFGNEVSDFDVTGFGFSSGDYNLVTNELLDAVRNHYYSIPTTSQNGLSAIPDGFELAIDFMIGDIGVDPGVDEYYYMQIGSAASGSGSLGVAGGSAIRNSSGGKDPFNLGNGFVLGSTFSDNINGIGGVGNALTSGNLAATVNALAGTMSHEIGHALSLGHVAKAGSVTPNGLSPLMGTGAIDLPNIDRISAREFSLSASNGSNNINQLVSAVGLRPVAVPEPASAAILWCVVGACLVGRRTRIA